MKPSTTDIQVKQNKANFIAWLLTEFSENEFTNSEMKKHYDEAISKAIENASEATMIQALKTMLNDPASDWNFYAPVRFYIVRKKEKVVHVVFATLNKSIMDIPYNALALYIDPLLNFPKSYTLNKEPFKDESFFGWRKENITICKVKSIDHYPPLTDTITKCSDEEKLINHSVNGEYSIKFDEFETVRYYFKLNGAKAASYIMNQTNAAKKLREERTQCLINEMTEADKIDVLERLADYYGYFLE